MEQFFHTLLTMSATAAIAALVVMVLRLPLKKAPRYLTCLLWLVVLFRMVCPVSFEAPVSIMPQAITTETYQTIPLPLPESSPVIQPETPTTEAAVPTEPAAAPAETGPTLTQVLLPIWAAGAAGMLLWLTISYLRLRRRVADAVLIRDNIYETDRVDTPFVCGFVKPRIYLPAGLTQEDMTYVLLHEQAHIRRLDHLVKPLFWLALCAHWFNPVLWLACWLLGKDIETACDQAVIRSFDREDTAGYAAALLHLGRDRSLPQTVPLAFGEENPKKRVKNLLDYKHPGIWIGLFAMAVCFLAAIILLADPGEQAEQYEGVALTRGELIQNGIHTPLSDDLRNDLVAILHDYGHTVYENIDMVDLADNTIKLTNANEGTIFFFHPETLTLVRVNHDGYSNIRKLAYVDEAIAEDPEFVQWMEEMDLYAETGRADELLAMKTPYVGDASAVGELIAALGIPEVVGDYGYTMELQTDTQPYGITLHFENLPMFWTQRQAFTQYMRTAGECLLELVDNAQVFSWTYDSPWGSTGGTTEPDKSQSDFQLRYDRMQEAAADYLAVQAQVLWATDILYTSDERTYAVTISVQPQEFSAHVNSYLSSTLPETDTVEGYRYSDHLSAEILEKYYPEADSLQLDQYSMLGTHCYTIYDGNNQDTGYRIFELIPINQDGVTTEPDYYVAHMTFRKEVQDWVMDYLVKADLTSQ